MHDIAWKVGVLSFLEPRNAAQARWSRVPYSNYSYHFTIPGFLRRQVEAALTSLLGTMTHWHSLKYSQPDANVASCWLYLKEYINDARSHECQTHWHVSVLWNDSDTAIKKPTGT
jgi:hypothetical protein